MKVNEASREASPFINGIFFALGGLLVALVAGKFRRERPIVVVLGHDDDPLQQEAPG